MTLFPAVSRLSKRRAADHMRLSRRSDSTSRLFFEPTIKADDDLTLIIAKHTGESMDLAVDHKI